MRISRTRCLRRRGQGKQSVWAHRDRVGVGRPAASMRICWHGVNMQSVKPQHVAGSATDTTTGCWHGMACVQPRHVAAPPIPRAAAFLCTHDSPAHAIHQVGQHAHTAASSLKLQTSCNCIRLLKEKLLTCSFHPPGWSTRPRRCPQCAHTAAAGREEAAEAWLSTGRSRRKAAFACGNHMATACRVATHPNRPTLPIVFSIRFFWASAEV